MTKWQPLMWSIAITFLFCCMAYWDTEDWGGHHSPYPLFIMGGIGAIFSAVGLMWLDSEGNKLNKR